MTEEKITRISPLAQTLPVGKGASDMELMRRLAQGDERALSELYDRYSRLVYATGIRILGSAP